MKKPTIKAKFETTSETIKVAPLIEISFIYLTSIVGASQTIDLNSFESIEDAAAPPKIASADTHPMILFFVKIVETIFDKKAGIMSNFPLLFLNFSEIYPNIELRSRQ